MPPTQQGIDVDDLQSLYQEMILEHKKAPRNYRAMDEGTQRADGHNPLCGDQLTLYVVVVDGVVTDLSFQGSGCAISTASASMMTEALKGKPVAEAHRMFRSFHALVTGQPPPAEGAPLGKLAALEGVRAFPMRVKCATLAWHTLEAALAGQAAPVSTE